MITWSQVSTPNSELDKIFETTMTVILIYSKLHTIKPLMCNKMPTERAPAFLPYSTANFLETDIASVASGSQPRLIIRRHVWFLTTIPMIMGAGRRLQSIKLLITSAPVRPFLPHTQKAIRSSKSTTTFLDSIHPHFQSPVSLYFWRKHEFPFYTFTQPSPWIWRTIVD